MSFDFHRKVLSRWPKKACDSHPVAEDLNQFGTNKSDLKSLVKLLHSYLQIQKACCELYFL